MQEKPRGSLWSHISSQAGYQFIESFTEFGTVCQVWTRQVNHLLQNLPSVALGQWLQSVGLSSFSTSPCFLTFMYPLPNKKYVLFLHQRPTNGNKGHHCKKKKKKRHGYVHQCDLEDLCSLYYNGQKYRQRICTKSVKQLSTAHANAHTHVHTHLLIFEGWH